MFHVSLGTDCSIAYWLQYYGCKRETLIFDWAKSPNLNKVLALISNRFKDLFEELEILDNRSNFPLLAKEDFDDHGSKNLQFYKNIRYNLTFPHDNISTFQETYQKTNNQISKDYF